MQSYSQKTDFLYCHVFSLHMLYSDKVISSSQTVVKNAHVSWKNHPQNNWCKYVFV